jgi:hypothetical protein
LSAPKDLKFLVSHVCLDLDLYGVLVHTVCVHRGFWKDGLDGIDGGVSFLRPPVSVAGLEAGNRIVMRYAGSSKQGNQVIT